MKIIRSVMSYSTNNNLLFNYVFFLCDLIMRRRATKCCHENFNQHHHHQPQADNIIIQLPVKFLNFVTNVQDEDMQVKHSAVVINVTDKEKEEFLLPTEQEK
eukprot:CAMPEP_0117034978 /NCGR_PEP_ID=MMETSP0472-20121206/24870_1 /TAXON_ID=693140 ORGANISM="Tiarina fusus, Strain LIS" /NCGR_SAMPLE_ID=MMETSP0472 /ASSEMBLY_ACC=CAM_ASM_000603 /LENGTH=101 /DNA_ID=CAMNT_0004744311 /DNA_START=322 /DNA_END=627 /DNA_ORIENTATION=+